MAPVFLEIVEVMRKPLVAGNWKMHGNVAEVDVLLDGLADESVADAKVEVVVCPPYLHIATAVGRLDGSAISVGAQNLCINEQKQGAYTGEISADMLVDIGCRYVLVGHSERREYYSESDEVVAEKFVMAQRAGLLPILCVGESLAVRESGAALSFVERQLDVVISHVGIEAFSEAVVAYEPVWAIGTGRTASPEQAQEVHEYIRGIFSQRDRSVAAGLRILYGGSVKADNASLLFAKPDIDGALVGGASLSSGDFSAIWQAVE